MDEIMIDDNENLKKKIFEEILISPVPEVLGENKTFEEMLDESSVNEVNRTLLDKDNKYAHVIKDPHSAEFFIEDLLRTLRPVNEEDYFKAVASSSKFGGSYDQYLTYKEGQMQKSKAVAFGKYFREAALLFEKSLRENITSEMMHDYLYKKMLVKIKSDRINDLQKICSESVDLFSDDYERGFKYAKTYLSVSLSEFEIYKRKRLQFKEALYLSIESGSPILFFIPQCLRYFYDQNGDQQIIANLDPFKYKSLNGEAKTKGFDNIFHESLTGLDMPSILSQIGVPVKIIVPVMDHELLRPERMNTDENHRKVKSYINALKLRYDQISCQKNIDIEVISSLGLFGVPCESSEFKSITEQLTKGGGVFGILTGVFGVSNRTYVYAVDEEFKRNNIDTERSAYYRSREFAELCRRYDVGEAYFHAIKMSDYRSAIGLAGVITRLPKGAEFDASIFNLVEDLITYQ
ncbi:hypothetical protein CO058_00100 [candidate division WWE3 bacterium CG_4_9_14_0_2_um_filter_35_11]|uniref:Uncharacterized protein n=1 Tax=candidate division WWE3 bacterium CG_4_9_14_0_2_um_filter_35_11 TaxID=1975077 RepID=A0A2M8EMU4_UNCKA|nr:MAG: hypothetical protein CO058_00100 [candidate division WWE3 bacterium CG_4_9_14_0_2_um_filter_35_11]